MAKKIKEVKMQLESGKANPAPPVGTALGPTGINLMEFCKQFNERTKETPGMTIPVVVSVFDDRTFSFILKTPPVADLIKKALSLGKGSSEPNKAKVGTLSLKQVEEIAQKKMADLNAYDLEGAKKMVSGTARSMGVLVER